MLSLCGIDLYARLGLTKLRCGFHELTGFYCPGCGGTRSTLSLLKFRPLRSFLYHPLPLYVAALLVNFMVRFISAYLLPARVDRRLKPPRFRVAYVIIAAALLAVNFLVRNLLLLAGIDTLCRLIYSGTKTVVEWGRAIDAGRQKGTNPNEK